MRYLSGEHFITVGTGDALDSAMFGLSHVDVSYVGAQVGLGGEYPDTHVAPLVARVVSETAHLPGQLGGQTLLLLQRDYTVCLTGIKLTRHININKFRCGTHIKLLNSGTI